MAEIPKNLDIEIPRKKTFRNSINKIRENIENQELSSLDISDKDSEIDFTKKIKKTKRKKSESEDDFEEQLTNGLGFYDIFMLSKLPNKINNLKELQNSLRKDIQKYKKQYIQECFENKNKISSVPKNSIPISADVRTYNFENLAKIQKKLTNQLFDVIMMDPPWQLSTSTPSRGVAIGYDSLSDDLISNIPVNILQHSGFLFIWVINAKFEFTKKIMKIWGYNLIDEIVWIKKTVNGKIAQGHGFYLQHSKETCLVGVKNIKNIKYNKNISSDTIFSGRRGQSQKPNEIYELIEKLVPNGKYLEIFGRRNNLRDNWVTIGNEL